MTDYSDVRIATTETMAMQKREEQPPPQLAMMGGAQMAFTPEVAREIAKVQASLMIAAARPRDEMQVWARVKRSCARTQLAEQANYAYKRGSTMIQGPTIRLAEAVAIAYTNIDYGFDVIAQRPGESEVEAYCTDKEANVTARRKFVVRHVRDLKEGSAELTAERDKYEMIANQAQRRVRACILEILPGDLVDYAKAECEKTIERGDGRPLAERVQSMLESFADLGMGIGPAQIETLLQHPVTAIVEAELPKLRSVYTSLKTGMAKPEELFAPKTGTVSTPNPAPAAAPAKAPRKNAKGKAAPEPQPDPQTGEVPQSADMTDEEKAEYERLEREEAERERAAIADEGKPRHDADNRGGGFSLKQP